MRVEPRPGALLFPTADRIHFRHDLRNNHIRACYVTRTVDDALILHSLATSTLVPQTGPGLSNLVTLTTGTAMQSENTPVVNGSSYIRVRARNGVGVGRDSRRHWSTASSPPQLTRLVSRPPA